MMFDKIYQSTVSFVVMFAVVICAVLCVLKTPSADAEELVLVEEGVSRAPIVIFADAPPLTRQAAEELAYYMEKTSGARPEVIDGEPDPVPEHAIWVGYQPLLDELFPEQNFEFEYPEEILIAANERHLVIAGRDRWDPENLVVPIRLGRTLNGFQQEYGTHNAVYTFLHDELGVRWLWPGELGEDILRQETVAFEPFSYRYHPQVRARGGMLSWAQVNRGVRGPDDPALGQGAASSHFWARAQRLQLSELPAPGGHGFPGDWWDRFHESHPEYFALQPDGTRSGYPGTPQSPGRNAKMCHSNPDLARQWLDDVAAKLEENPNQRVFNASPGDSYHSGHCICENCLAWDHPDGEPRRLVWQGLSQVYVALSDRDVTFANRVARGLKERFPDKDLYVYMLAYGHSCPPPVEAVPDDNVIIGNVANFLFRSDAKSRDSIIGATNREYFEEWGKLTDMHFWRPNIGAPVGIQWGMPDVPLRRTMDDLRFAAEHGWMGIYVDFIRENWSTQGPLYYLMAQLTWDPYQDGEEILKDYYQRAFGPAAKEMEAYWTYMEEIREECYGTEQPGRADHDILEFYNEERLDKAADLLEAGKLALSEEDGLYKERIAFVEVGLDVTRLITENGRLVREYNRNATPDHDRTRARNQIHENWEELRALQQDNPGVMRWNLFWGGPRGDGAPTTPRYAPTLWVQ